MGKMAELDYDMGRIQQTLSELMTYAAERFPMSKVCTELDDLEERTSSVLLKVVRHLTKEEFELLCWQCGQEPDDYQTMPIGEKE